jgi:hypothetical protein
MFFQMVGSIIYLIFDEIWFRTDQTSIYCCLYNSRVSLFLCGEFTSVSRKQTCPAAATTAQITKKKEENREGTKEEQIFRLCQSPLSLNCSILQGSTLCFTVMAALDNF